MTFGAKKIFSKLIILSVIFSFTLNCVLPPASSFAQNVPTVTVTPAILLTENYSSAVIRGLKVYPDNPLKFDFIIDKGNLKDEGKGLKDETARLIKYFLASLTTPEKEMWVNLNPKAYQDLAQRYLTGLGEA